MIYPVTGWFKIRHYDNRRSRIFIKLVLTTWLTGYPKPMEITYDQVSEFIGHEFRKSLVEMEYGITSKGSTSVNPNPNETLERIKQVLVNLVRDFYIK